MLPETGRERLDEHGLERADVPERALAPACQIEDRVADELARTVERDVAAPVGAMDGGAQLGQRTANAPGVVLHARGLAPHQRVGIHGDSHTAPRRPGLRGVARVWLLPGKGEMAG